MSKFGIRQEIVNRIGSFFNEGAKELTMPQIMEKLSLPKTDQAKIYFALRNLVKDGKMIYGKSESGKGKTFRPVDGIDLSTIVLTYQRRKKAVTAEAQANEAPESVTQA
mgnify:CR=1 FL=1